MVVQQSTQFLLARRPKRSSPGWTAHGRRGLAQVLVHPGGTLVGARGSKSDVQKILSGFMEHLLGAVDALLGAESHIQMRCEIMANMLCHNRVLWDQPELKLEFEHSAFGATQKVTAHRRPEHETSSEKIRFGVFEESS